MYLNQLFSWCRNIKNLTTGWRPSAKTLRKRLKWRQIGLRVNLYSRKKIVYQNLLKKLKWRRIVLWAESFRTKKIVHQDSNLLWRNRSPSTEAPLVIASPGALLSWLWERLEAGALEDDESTLPVLPEYILAESSTTRKESSYDVFDRIAPRVEVDSRGSTPSRIRCSQSKITSLKGLKTCNARSLYLRFEVDSRGSTPIGNYFFPE